MASGFTVCHMLYVVAAISISARGFPDQKEVTTVPGQNVTLPCRAPNNNKNNIIAAEWSRADLKPEYVLCYRDEQFDPEDQHPSFVNRVELQDRQMRGGDVSLILKDVTINDTGTYECHVAEKEGEPMRLIASMNLRVVPLGQPGGLGADAVVGLIVGVLFLCVIAVALVVVYFRYKKESPYQFPSEQPQIKIPAADLQSHLNMQDIRGHPAGSDPKPSPDHPEVLSG